MSYHWQTITKWFSEWWHGKQRHRPEQHVFRRPGKVEEDPVSYELGFWEKTAKPFAKTAMFLSLAAVVVAAIPSGINAGCAYSEKTSADAEKIVIDTNRDAPCTSSLVTRKGSESMDTKCKHKDHVLRTKWERGELTIQCLCPNTVEDEKNRPQEEEGSEVEVDPEPVEEIVEEPTSEPQGVEI